MLSHEFQDMPAKSVGNTPLLTSMESRCRWCMKQPAKAQKDGCPIHELEMVGQILLSTYNPEGVEYFKDRICETCERPIMGHWLRKGSTEYWCYENQNQFSYGVTGCIHDVSDVRKPVEEAGVRGQI